MAGPYDVLGFEETTQLLVALARNRLPTQRFSESTDNWRRLRVLGGGIVDTHAHVAAVHKALDPFDAEGELLTKLAAAFGVVRGGATSARKAAAGRLRGTVAAAYDASMTLLHAPTQLRFRLDSTGTIPAAGYVDVGIVAIDTGSATRLAAAEVLKLTPAQAGLTTDVELQIALSDDGLDAEGDGDLRVRLLERLASAAQGGNETDWWLWCVEAPGAQVYRTFVYPHRNGLGAVDVACLHRGTGAARLLSSTERAAVLAYLSPGKRPVSAAARVLEVVEDPQTIKVTVTPRNDQQYAKDWDDTTLPTVLAYTPATRTIQFTAARPASMRAGHRIVWDAAGGEHNVIQALTASDSVQLTTDPTTAPILGQQVRSGGPLTLPVSTAIRALVDGLGPAVGDFGLNWESALTFAGILTASQSVSGVLNTVVVAPVADYAPADYGYPADTQVPIVSVGRVFVRYA